MNDTASDDSLHEVLVVGGGTAGWLAACHLARRLRPREQGGVRVTLVESADIPTIGVGEGTVPAIRRSLEYLGVSETDFLRACDASFKQSIKFIDWRRQSGHSYHHVFDYPWREQLDLTPYWLLGDAAGASFADSVGIQSHVCDAGLGPKHITHAEYAGITNYAYHLDAAKFARLLCDHATKKLGVRHLKANITGVARAPDGGIAHLLSDAHGELHADLYVDCTGFASVLLGQNLEVPFIDQGDVLLADFALASQVPYAESDSPIPCFTLASAREAGWIWDIGLTTRRGTGYVYSSRHCTHEQAELTLRAYLKETLGEARAEAAGVRRIPMRVGYREKFWYRNCAAIGLAQGFVEPLEATGLLMFDATARMLADQFPANRAAMPLLADRFNQRVRFAWERVIDFIKLHYVVSDRDEPFWADNRDPATIPKLLGENLALWRHQPPSEYDFSSRLEVFNIENYLYVLYGMDFPTRIAPIAGRFGDRAAAVREMERVRRAGQAATRELLPHRALLARINEFGLQKV